MKSKILGLIHDKPKHYAKLIKNDQKLLNWVMQNSLAPADSNFLTHVYSAVNSKDTLCPHGKHKEVTRFSNGLNYCGHSSVCLCSKENLKAAVSDSKNRYSDLEKININNKRIATMQEKYGVDYNSQRPEVKATLQKPKIPDEIYNKLIDKSWLENEYVVKERTSVDIAKELGIYYSTVLYYCNLHGFNIRQVSNYSLVEKEITEWVSSLGLEVELNNRTILKGKEIDIFIPSLNFGIEVNGLFWHSLTKEINSVANQKRHLHKTEQAQLENIELFHVTDFEWQNKKEIIKNMLKSKFGFNQRVYARKLQISEISTSDAKLFLNKYHLQGFAASSYYIALKDNDNILSLASFGKSRFNNQHYELIRLATKEGITVVGGLSRLLSHFKKISNITNIISYCDRSKSNGNGYSKAGFELVKYTKPGFYWTNGNDVVSRYVARGNSIKKILSNYDSSLSQDENMFNHGYRKYWDCGNSVWELK